MTPSFVSILNIGRSRYQQIFSGLPIELIDRIVRFLDDDESPSFKYRHHEPSTVEVRSPSQPLKTLSQTCLLLRAVTLRHLFRFLKITCRGVDYYERDIKGLLLFIKQHRSQIQTISVVVRLELADSSADVRLLLDGFFRGLCPTIMSEMKPETLAVTLPSTIFSSLWISSPDGMPRRDDSWAFDMPFHILHLTCPQAPSRLQKESLWDYSWSNVALNEGSSLKVYSTYEYFLKQTPSMFRLDRFCSDLTRGLWSSTVRSFEYVAIFPMSVHMIRVLDQLKELHNLQIFTTRLAPHENSSILSDPDRVGKCQLADLWMEFEESYAMVANFVQHMGESHSLKEFRTLDCTQPTILEILRPALSNSMRGWEETTNTTWSKITSHLNPVA